MSPVTSHPRYSHDLGDEKKNVAKCGGHGYLHGEIT